MLDPNTSKINITKLYQDLSYNKYPESDVYYNLGLVLLNSGKVPEAVRALQVACTYPISQEKAQQLSATLLYLGLQCHKRGLLELSLNCYLCSLICNPHVAAPYSYLGVALKSLGYSKESNLCNSYYMISNNLLKKPFSLQDWKESIYSTSTNYRTVYSPQNYDLESPNTSDLVVNPAFDRYSDITVKTKTGILVEIPNGASQISFNASLCLSEKGKVIEEVSTGSYGFLYFSQPLRLKEYREVDGIVAMCAIRQNWGSAYYHWIIEVLPYFLILKARHKIWNEIDYFYLNSLDCDFQKESLRAFGLDSSKVIESKKDPKIKAKKMYVPFEVYGDMKMPSPEILSKLKNVFLNAEQTQVNSKHPKNWQRIYISRSQAKHRKLVNEDILITFLKSQNFTIVNLENMSVSEQANIINSSQVIVAPHGAGLTNIVFANPGTTVIEIFSPNYINCCYWLVAQAMQLKYWYFVGNVVNKPHQAQVRNECLEDISIDIERFKLFLGSVFS